MDEKPPPLSRVLLLGATLLAVGGLLFVWSGQRVEPPGPATVEVRILAPDDSVIFSGDGLGLSSQEATVLGALLEAARVANLTVDVTYGFGGQAFVRSIDGHENRGNCGWVWDLNEVRGDRAADLQPVVDDDRVLWHWDCEF